MTDPECIIRIKDNVGEEQFLQKNADDFVANALWCGKVSCQGLIAFTPMGLAERGYCPVKDREFSDANSYTLEDEPEQEPTEEQASSELTRMPEQVTAQTNIHEVARLAAYEAAQSSSDFSFRDISDDLIGGVGTGVLNDPQIGRRV